MGCRGIVPPIRLEDAGYVSSMPARISGTILARSELTPPDQPDPRSWLAAIVHSSDDAIISKDLNGTIMSWNEAAVRLFGYPALEAIGNPITLIIPPDRLDEETHILNQVRAGVRVDHFETIRRRKDGSLLDVSLTVSPIRNAAGRIVGASKIARDISTRKELERQQQENERQRNEFLGILAHELRNPLAPLRTSLEVIRLMNDDPDSMRRLRQLMERQVTQLSRLVNDLVDVSRVSTGTVELNLEFVDVGDVLHSAVEASRPGIDDGRHSLKIEVAEEPLVVIGDAGRLTQVLTNILNNAARYTDPGGSICMSAWQDGAQIRIAVRDNGIGIAAEDVPRVLQMFGRSDAARNRTREGLGVGIPLAKRLVELQGGSLLVESDGPGHGSTFTVVLPAVTGTPGLS
jgi:PAS domain S-box-containing protein